MSLRFIYGRAGSGKSFYCLNDIKDKINKNTEAPLILLVPEQFSLQAERNLVEMIETGGIIKAEVLSFKRMAYKVFSDVGLAKKDRINSAGKCMLIQKILENYKNDLKSFSGSVNLQGFVNTIADIITEFKRYDVTPDDLEKICDKQNTWENTPMLEYKLKDLTLIYKEYERIICEKYRDLDDDLTLLYEKLDETTLFDNAQIWIDEFSGFTIQEYKIISKLLQKAFRVNISLCTDCLIDEKSLDSFGHGYMDYKDVFSPVKNAVNKLLQIAKKSNVSIEPPVIMDKCAFRFKNSAELEHLEKHFFSFPYKQFKDSKDISIFTASNIYKEIEHIARDIIDLCRNKRLRYKDITVVCGNLDTYEKFIITIFKEHGIPFFIDKKKSINKHPLIQLIMSVFEVFIYNWSYESVFGYLKTGLTGTKREDIDLLENYVLALGLKGNRWTSEKDWDYIPEMTWDFEKIQEYKELILKINKIRKNITAPLLDLQAKISKTKTAKEVCEALFNFFCVLEIPKRINSLIDKFEETGELGLAGEYRQIWNIVMEVLDQIVALMGDENISLKRLYNIFRIGFSEHKTGLIPPSLDQVLVGNIERSKSHEVQALYILGVNDGVFPAAAKGEGILSDKDRGKLQGLGLELAKDTKTKAFEDQYMVYLALTISSKYLKLSVPIADYEGKTLRPSIIISRLRKIFPNIIETNNIVPSNDIQEELELVSSKIPTFNQLLIKIRKALEGNSIAPLWKDVYLWYINKEKWEGKCQKAYLAVNYSNLPLPLSKKRAFKLYGNPLYSSISRFEQYSSCPFAYYIRYGLGVKERKMFELSLPDIGTFLHAVMEEFFQYINKENIPWKAIEKEWCKQKVSQISDNLLENMLGGPIKHGTKRYRVLTKRLDQVLFRAIWTLVLHTQNSSFEPIGNEINFGYKNELPPINIDLSKGRTIKLTGRVDRIDAFKTEEKTYIRIIDYKSGNKDFSLSKVYHGLQVQLVAYLDALWKGLDGAQEIKAPIIPGGILYFKIADPIIKGNKDLKEDEIEKAIMKELKMNGLLLEDVKMIKEMDKTIDGNSLIIPARINKDDVIGKISSTANLEQFNALRSYVRKLLKELGNLVLEGDISIMPYKNKKDTACKYCSFASICQFDPMFPDNRYRVISDKANDEIWDLMHASSILDSSLKEI